jgi:peptide/nickel transport system substrate-binding protein
VNLNRRPTSLLLLILLVSALVVACAPAVAPTGDTASSEAAEATGETTTGGTLLIASPATEIKLDPTATTSNEDIMLHLNLYELLYRVNRDGSALEPSAAESYDVSDDLKVWTFHLRPDLKFSDGSPLTADDVVFSIERGMREESLWAWLYQDAGLESVAAPDAATVVFTLNKPFVPFLSYLAGYWASIFPKAALEAQGEAFWEKPISSGPFMVKEIVQAEHVTLERNPNSRVQPILDEVEIILIPDDNTRMLKLQAGEVDVAVNVPFSQIDAMNELPGLSVAQFPFAFTGVLTPNHAKPPFDDVNFRLALNYAVDREALINAVLFGHGEVPTSFLPKGVMYWDDTVPGYPFDLDKAKEYLAQSNYADGASFEIWTSTTNVSNIEIATALQGMWSQLPGVDVQVVQLEPGVMTERRNAGEQWITTGGFSSDVVDPDQITNWYITGFIHQYTNADISGVQPIIAQAQTEVDPDKRRQLYSDIQHWAWENALNVGIYYSTNNWGVADQVKDLWVDPVMGLRLHEVAIGE